MNDQLPHDQPESDRKPLDDARREASRKFRESHPEVFKEVPARKGRVVIQLGVRKPD